MRPKAPGVLAASTLLAASLLVVGWRVIDSRTLERLTQPVGHVPAGDPPAAGDPLTASTDPLLQAIPHYTSWLAETGRVDFRIRDGLGVVTWSCGFEVPIGRFDKDSPCRAATGWMRRPGPYTLEASGPGSDGKRETKRVTFSVDGTESRIVVLFTDAKASQESIVTRYRPAPPSVTLEASWTPEPRGKPTYLLKNGTRQALRGTGFKGNFFGGVERLVDGRWTPYHRGFQCGSVEPKRPLEPGGATLAQEGYFIGGPRPFSPGRYRFWVAYGHEPTAEKWPLAPRRPTDYYEVSAEFEILVAASPAPRAVPPL